MTAPALVRDSLGAVVVPLRWVYGADAVLVRCYHRLRTDRGTALEDTARGLPWSDWQTREPVPLAEIEGAVREQVEGIPGVVEVSDVVATRSGSSISCSVRVRIDADGDLVTADVSASDPYATAGSPPWYLVSRRLGGGPILGS